MLPRRALGNIAMASLRAAPSVAAPGVVERVPWSGGLWQYCQASSLAVLHTVAAEGHTATTPCQRRNERGPEADQSGPGASRLDAAHVELVAHRVALDRDGDLHPDLHARVVARGPRLDV